MNKDGFNHINKLKKYISEINSNKGFTLVELIVVMVVLSIMLTLGGFAILKWQDWATFNQENEYAQTLFVAAQNQLAEYSANGRLETLQKDLKDGDAYGASGKGLILRLDSDSFGIINEEGIKYTKDSVWVEAYKKTAAERDKYIDDIVAIRADSGDYDMYESDPVGLASTNPEAYWVYELLGAYVYDKSILNNAAISIEFTPDDGQVFAVLYSDKNSSFIYKTHEGVEESAGISDIEDRQELYRNDRMVGYYGVDTLTKATRDKENLAQAEVKNVLLHNENTLNLTFDITEGEIGSLNYKVTLKTSESSSGGVYTDALEIIVPSNSLSNNFDEVLCDVVKMTEGGTEDLGKMKFRAGIQSSEAGDPQVVLILDAADIHAESNLYKDYLVSGENHMEAFKDTYSIFRFGIDMAYAKCEVLAYGTGYIDSDPAESNTEHMCVKSMQEKNALDGNGKIMEYTLTNARHLYNVRFLQVDIANDSAHIGANYLIRNFDENEEDDDGRNVIDWAHFQNNSSYNRLYDSNPVGTGWTISSLPQDYSSIEKCAFPSIENLGTNDRLFSEVANYELKNFKLDSRSNVLYMHSKSYTDTAEKSVGLVMINNGMIDNLQMTNVTVHGSQKVGAFAGENYGDLKSLTVVNVDSKDIFGDKYLGAITGYNYKSGTVDMCEAKAGRIGRKPDTNINAPSYVGGLVGCNEGFVKNTDGKLLSNIAAVYGDEYIGGVVGYNDKDAVIDGLKYNCGIVDGISSVGGISGYNAGKISANNTISITPNVMGMYYVGGVVGYNDAGATITKYKVNKGTIIGDEDKSCYVGGYVGFNSSIDLLQGQDKKALVIMSSPSKVTGAYYVGGCIGGNILNTHGYSNKIEDDKPVDIPEDNSNIDVGGISVPVTDSTLYSLINANAQINRNGEGTLYITLEIHNDTAADYDGAWSIDLSTIKGIGDYKIESNCGNNIYVKDNIIRDGCSGYIDNNLRWTQKISVNNIKEIQITLTHNKLVSDDAVFNAIKKAKWAVEHSSSMSSIGIRNNNTNLELLSIVGPIQLRTSNPTPDSGKVWIEVRKVDSNNSYGQYNVIIHNETPYALDNWEFYLYFSDVVPGEIWGAPYTIQGNTIKYERGNWGNTTIGANSDFTALAFNVKAGEKGKDYYDNFTTTFSGDLFNSGNKIASFDGGHNPGTNPTPENPTIQIDVINASFANSNYSGELSGKAFVGGYIGYNMMVDSPDALAVRDHVQKAYRDAVEGTGSLADKYITVDNIMISDLGTNIMKSDVRMWINKDDINVNNNIGKVVADICVGGIFGYNNDETYLTIYNSNNYSMIIANSYIEYAREQVDAADNPRIVDYEGKNKVYYYSYAGGIVGTNNKLTIINNCANKSSSFVVSNGTYTGGLCEVNDGVIINCKIDNFGDSTKEYIGGLCGLNKGNISDCDFVTKTVGGSNVVGGVASENFGYISNITISNPKIMAYGKSVVNVNGEMDIHGLAGLYAGYNGYSGRIDVENDLLNATVDSSGRYVGLVVGYNSGKIFNKKTSSDKKNSTDDNLLLSGNVRGYKTVGAICGFNNNDDTDFAINNYTNKSPIISKLGEAGGIIGYNDSVNNIKYCVNEALVSASDEGNAGGITSVNDGLIEYCYNYLSVNAPNGMSGGITAINDTNGEISNCYVGAKMDSGEVIKFSSKTFVGGVAAQNDGIIKDNILRNLLIRNADTNISPAMGVIVGINNGSVIMATKPSIIDCKVYSNVSGSRIGGVAGTNTGIISTEENNEEKSLVKNIDLSISTGTYASIGGVAGENTGLISNISVNGTIKGFLGSSKTGYGGIAGFSGYLINDTGNSYTARIENCSFDGVVNASGTSGDAANIGGIAGVNGYNSEIKSCYIGVDSSEASTYIAAGDYINKTNEPSKTDMVSYAYVGGIAGSNYGKISKIDMHDNNPSDNIYIISFAGEVGGFVGYNYPGATVSGSNSTDRLATSDKMSVEMRRGENNRGPGGVIGLNASGQAIKYVDNYASVSGIYPSNIKTGGLIGINMQQEKYQLLISNCNNYGEVVGWGNTGGFVGHDWFRGISFDSCSNYGFIHISEKSATINDAQKYAGGFIGRACYATSPHYFFNCKNHGNIETCGNYRSSAGGFIGQIEDSSSLQGQFYNCVNTGVVKNVSDALISRNDTKFVGLGHFVGWCDMKSSWTLELCRNYNTHKVTDGFAYNSVCIKCLDAGLHVEDNNFVINPNSKGSAFCKDCFYISNNTLHDNIERNGLIALYIEDTDSAISSYVSVIDEKLALKLSKNSAANGRYQIDYSKSTVSYALDETTTEKDSRMAVYWDIDPKFLELINTIDSNNLLIKYSVPTNPKACLKAGRLVFSWDSVNTDKDGLPATPYGYEIYCELQNPDGSNIALDVDNTAIQRFTNIEREEWLEPIEIKEEWISSGYILKLKVRATANKDDVLVDDSDLEKYEWAECSLDLSVPELPEPIAHLEVTSDNKMVAILDNPEAFDASSIIKDESGNLVPVKFSDICYIDINVENKGGKWNFKIDPTNGNIISTGTATINNGSYTSFTGKAVPKDDYIDRAQESSVYLVKGTFENNNSLTTKDRYTNTTIDFKGFSGSDDPDILQYAITTKNGDDAYLTADFGAYDPNMGLYIYYDRQTAHLGASAGGGNNVYNSFTLSNIPVELFGDIKAQDMEARVYIDYSQNKMIHYGHFVTDIDLDPDDIAGNYNILSQIKDEYHLTTKNGELFVDKDYLIWDSGNKTFKPGYSLYANSDDSYSIYYNATIELAMEKAKSDNASKVALTNGVARKYYRYAVDVMRYCAFDNYSNTPRTIGGITLSGDNNKVDLNYLQDGYYIRKQSVESGDYNAFNISKFNNSKPDKYFINIAPTPIVDGEMNVSIDDEGHKTYSVQWDKYYKDTYAWDASRGYYYSSDSDKISYAGYEIDNIDKTAKVTLPTVDTWESFKASTNFYNSFIENVNNSGNRQWLRLAMNTYFYSYDDAKYKAVLMGKTSSGEYVELSSIDVDSPVDLSVNDKFSYYISANNKVVNDNKYEYKAYKAEFTENNNEWSGYSDITIRIVRLGNNNRYGSKVKYSDCINLSGWDSNYLFVLPRYTEVEYVQKQPLQTLMVPAVSIVENEDGKAIDSLLYNVSFDLIDNEDMLSDLGGYIIEVKEVADDAEGVVSSEETNPFVTYYLIKQNGKKLTNYGLDEGKTVIDVSKSFTSDNGRGNTVIDLYEYSSKTVEISVRALARDNVDLDNPTKYIHGQYSSPTEVLVLEALPTPVITSFVNTEVKDSDSENAKIIDYEFSYTDVDDDNDNIGDLYGVICSKDSDTTITIQAQIDIFDEMSDSNVLIDSLYSADAPLDITRFDNADIPPALNSVNLISGEITQKVIFEDYAGYWMRIALRAHSESIIDSKWTYELDSEDLTNDDKYIWIQIPKMEVEDTTTIDVETISSEVYDDVTIDGKTYNVSITQQSFNILIDPNVDIYTFNFAKAENASGAEIPDKVVIEKVEEEVDGTVVSKWYLLKYDTDGNVSNKVDISTKTEVDGFYNNISVSLGSEADAPIASLICKAFISIVDNSDKQYINIVVPDALIVSLKSSGTEDIVAIADVDNSNGFISLLSMEVKPELNENNAKQKDLKTNSTNKYEYKKEELDDFFTSKTSYSLGDDDEPDEDNDTYPQEDMDSDQDSIIPDDINLDEAFGNESEETSESSTEETNDKTSENDLVSETEDAETEDTDTEDTDTDDTNNSEAQSEECLDDE